ncbi:transcriptional regulator of TetR family [alpha proteobacterium U9-1i]|nr:transcriptional regulator of TetR family [alpha proteobacterium U9-1i]
MPENGPAEARVTDRGSARRHAFLCAAREEFLARGYEAANVNEVVRQAGGSLATLYAQFGNKEGLFHAVMEDQHARFVADFLTEDADHLSLEEGLEVVGLQVLKAFLKRDNLAFYRITIGEGAKFPHLLQRYISAGALTVRGAISSYLTNRPAKDGRLVSAPEVSASFFLELIRSRHHYRALADPEYAPTDDELRAHVKATARVLLNGILAA